MLTNQRRWIVNTLLFLLAGGAVPAQDNPRKIDFVRDIQPIFKARCAKCHATKRPKGGFRINSKALAMKGGLTGKAIVPGQSSESLLVRLLESPDADARMPMKSDPLPKAQIDLIRAWIDQGADWPDSASVDVTLERHWAFVKPVRPALPDVKQRGWIRNPIDAFVLARLEKEGLRPSPKASRAKLIRRASLDLTGLPPSVGDVDAFVADDRPGAYEELVDRLLDSPQYGEHWARSWLDAARYADTNGFNFDKPRTMWKYRDWVVKALNDDMPFTQFTVEQIAGDMLPGATLAQKIATGFHRNTRVNTEGGVDRKEANWEVRIDRVTTTATVWLGATLGCAQCHNHKFDPFSQEDFYRFMAFFTGASEPKMKVPAGNGHAATTTLVMQEKKPKATQTAFLRLRGSFEAPGARVTAGTPASLHPMRKGLPANRLGLARWLVDEENPLVARVTVNRFWYYVFGRPLVETPEDFGTQSPGPEHPELLDWLATEFVRQGWSMKRIVRTIVTSATYRQSSKVTGDRLKKDPYNRLFSRGPRFRLDAESIRDVLLAASGQLSLKMGGPNVYPIQADTSGVIPINKVTTRWEPSKGEDRYRRGLYTHWRRTSHFVAFATLDAPSREVCIVKRPRTNTPLQALAGLNDPGFFDAARGLARRLMKEAKPDPRARATRAFRLCVSRPPDAEELDRLVSAFQRERDHFAGRPGDAEAVAGAPDPERAAWTMIANVLFNLDETITKE